LRTVDVVRAGIVAGIFFAVAAAPVCASGQLAAAAPLVPCSSQVGTFRFTMPAASQPFATFAAAISVSCAPATSFKVRFHSGNNCRMSAGGDMVAYALFADAAATKPLLDCAPGGDVELAGRGSQTFMVYGRTGLVTPAIGPGDYTDTISVQIEST